MASFVIHHIAGVKFLEKLEKDYDINLSEEEKGMFLLGNLIVDSVKTDVVISEDLSEEEAKKLRESFLKIIQLEKRKAHFRNLEDQNLVVQSPKVENFIFKYANLLKEDITVLGYLFHLYTDKMFFENLFDETFECLDKDNNPTTYIKDVNMVRVKKNDSLHKVNDFFDYKYTTSLYNDYTTINKILLEYYKIKFDSSELLEYVKSFINPGIEEVDYSRITSVISSTNSFINDSYNNKTSNLNVFDEDIIKRFIIEVVESFIKEYGYLLEKSNEALYRKLRRK